MISLYVTRLWLQRNGGVSRWRKCNRCKTNEKWGFGKVAQMRSSDRMRESSGEQEVCVVSLSLRICKTINSLIVARVRSSFAGGVLRRADLSRDVLGCAGLGWAGLGCADGTPGLGCAGPACKFSFSAARPFKKHVR